MNILIFEKDKMSIKYAQVYAINYYNSYVNFNTTSEKIVNINLTTVLKKHNEATSLWWAKLGLIVCTSSFLGRAELELDFAKLDEPRANL